MQTPEDYRQQKVVETWFTGQLTFVAPSTVPGAAEGLFVGNAANFNELARTPLPFALYPGIVRQPSRSETFQNKPDTCEGVPIKTDYAINIIDERDKRRALILDVTDNQGCLQKEWVDQNAQYEPLQPFLNNIVQGPDILDSGFAPAIKLNAWMVNEPPLGIKANLPAPKTFHNMTLLEEGQLACLGHYADPNTTYEAGQELFWCYGSRYNREYQTSCAPPS